MAIFWLPGGISRGIIHKYQALKCKRETENSAGDRKRHLKRNYEQCRLRAAASRELLLPEQFSEKMFCEHI